MSYITNNKAAWEEAFEHRRTNWGDENFKRLKNEELPFFNLGIREELLKIDFKNKSVAQFCCNNGREILSLMQKKKKKSLVKQKILPKWQILKIVNLKLAIYWTSHLNTIIRLILYFLQ